MGTNKPQPTTDRNGNEYSAYLFGGGSPTSLNNSNNHNYIKVANSPSMHLDNEMSVSFWMQQEYFYGHSGAHLIYTDAISDPSVRFSIFCKAGDGNSASPGVFINSGIQSDSSLFITSSNSDKNGGVSYGSTTIKHCYNTKEWVHYVCVVNKDTIKTYINGRLYIQNKIAEHMGSVFQSVNNLSLYIGRMVRDGGVSYWYPYNGKIDDVAFYNRAIMDDEVALLYGDYHDPYARKTYETTIYATIGCYKTYIWDGRLYNEPGTYNYLYTSKEYGCDSAVGLILQPGFTTRSILQNSMDAIV